MKRFHRELPLMYKRRNELIKYERGLRQFGAQFKLPIAEFIKQKAGLGRFRKRDIHDCGRAHCWFCHEKYHDRPMKEKKAILSFREQLIEIGASC